MDNIQTKEQLLLSALAELARQAQSALMVAAGSSDAIRARHLDKATLQIRDFSDALYLMDDRLRVERGLPAGSIFDLTDAEPARQALHRLNVLNVAVIDGNVGHALDKPNGLVKQSLGQLGG